MSVVVDPASGSLEPGTAAVGSSVHALGVPSAGFEEVANRLRDK